MTISIRFCNTLNGRKINYAANTWRPSPFSYTINLKSTGTKLIISYYNSYFYQNMYNPKNVWCNIKQIIHSTLKLLLPVTKLGKHDTEITDLFPIANIFNNYFATIGNKLTEDIYPLVEYIIQIILKVHYQIFFPQSRLLKLKIFFSIVFKQEIQVAL